MIWKSRSKGLTGVIYLVAVLEAIAITSAATVYLNKIPAGAAAVQGPVYCVVMFKEPIFGMRVNWCELCLVWPQSALQV